MSQTATLILTHGQIHTLDRANPGGSCSHRRRKNCCHRKSRSDHELCRRGTQIVDLKGHTVIPASTILTCT